MASCQPIGDCGSGTYGKIQIDMTTICVDQSYSGGASDGSISKPFTTINEALQAASTGGRIAVAAGEYKEDLKLDKSLTIEGRCAQMVKVSGQGQNPSATVEIEGAKTVLRGLTLTGPKVGVRAKNAQAELRQSAVQSCGSYGISVVDEAHLTLVSSLVNGNTRTGIHLSDADVIVQRSVVKNGQALPQTGMDGVGILAMKSKRTPTLAVSDSLVDENRTYGIALLGTQATLHRTVIRNTKGRKKDNEVGCGLYVADDGTAKLTMVNCLVENNRDTGILLFGARATLQKTVVKNTQPAASLRFGRGISLHRNNGPAQLTAEDCLVEGNRDTGIFLWGSQADLRRTVVRNTLPQVFDNMGGWGIGADSEVDLGTSSSKLEASSLSVTDCLITGNTEGGVMLFGAQATLQRTVVKDTQPRTGKEEFGYGIIAAMGKDPSRLTVLDSVVAKNRATGILVQRSGASLKRTVVADTQASGQEGGFGVGFFGGGPTASYGLEMSECLIESNRSVGVNILSSRATIERCAIRNTKATSSGHYGDGIEMGLFGADLMLSDSLIEKSARAGLLFWRSAKGSVTRSVFRGGTFAIDLEDGTSPVIQENNIYEYNKRNSISFGQGLQPAPVPTIPDVSDS